MSFRSRNTRLLDTLRLEGWTLKVYAITGPGESLASGLLDEALSFAQERLRKERLWMAGRPARPHGFVVIHQGDEAVWLLLDLWVEDILHQHTYRAPLDGSGGFAAAMVSGSPACVWELEVVRHERDAWVEHVFGRAEDPNYAGYLAAALRIEA